MWGLLIVLYQFQLCLLCNQQQVISLNHRKDNIQSKERKNKARIFGRHCQEIGKNHHHAEQKFDAHCPKNHRRAIGFAACLRRNRSDVNSNQCNDGEKHIAYPSKIRLRTQQLKIMQYAYTQTYDCRKEGNFF